MAIKNEKKRQVKFRKYQKNKQFTAAKDNQQRDDRQKPVRRTNNRGDAPVSANKLPSQVLPKIVVRKSVISAIKQDTWQGIANMGPKNGKYITRNLNNNCTGADTRQVNTEDSRTLSSVPPIERSEMSNSNLLQMGSVDPLSYLFSSDSKDQVDTI